MALKSFYQWLMLRDYEVAKADATELVVKRFSRGNTSAQNGWYMDCAELAELSRAADKAMSRLERRISL